MAIWIVCEKCGCVDELSLTKPPINNMYYCSECHPNCNGWHGFFKQLPYNQRVHKNVVNRVNDTPLQITLD